MEKKHKLNKKVRQCRANKLCMVTGDGGVKKTKSLVSLQEWLDALIAGKLQNY